MMDGHGAPPNDALNAGRDGASTAPRVPDAQPDEQPDGALALSCLLDEAGLLVLADEDILQRHAEVFCGAAQGLQLV